MTIEVTRHDIEEAAKRIDGLVIRTPVVEVEHNLIFKLDFLQPTGSFKVRGAFSFLTAHPEAEQVVTASGGNHGAAVAHAATRLGRRADVFVPSTSPRSKVGRIESLGATVHVIDGYYDDALAACRAHLAAVGGVEVHAYDHPDVVAGQGTVGSEIMTQVPDVDVIVVAVGGGGLIGGIASWVGDDARLIAAETTGTNTLHSALRAGRPVEVAVGGIAADSLGAARAGGIAFEAARRWVDESVVVDDDDVRDAQRWLWDRHRLVAEPGAATAVAAARQVYETGWEDRVCVLLCGANADLSTLASPGV